MKDDTNDNGVFEINLTNLPFEPDKKCVIFMESDYDREANEFIKKYAKKTIVPILESYSIRFIYLPDRPLPGRSIEAMEFHKSSDMLKFRIGNDRKKKIPPCFAYFNRYDIIDNTYFCAVYEAVSMDIDILISSPEFIFDIMAFIVSGICDIPMEAVIPKCSTDVFTTESDHPAADGEQTEEPTDGTSEIECLKKDIKNKLDTLRRYNISNQELHKLIFPQQRLSRLVVTPDMHLQLPDYGHMEIVLEPLLMALYLLFLHHPEGIVFKALPDYRRELTDLYISVCSKRGEYPGQLSVRQQRSIDNLLDPLSNSIHEKCTRIKTAFTSKFAEYIASDYYITGQRSEPKRIMLSRDMVKFINN